MGEYHLFLNGKAEAPRTELCTLLIYSLGEHPTEDRLYSVSYILCVPSVLQVSRRFYIHTRTEFFPTSKLPTGTAAIDTSYVVKPAGAKKRSGLLMLWTEIRALCHEPVAESELVFFVFLFSFEVGRVIGLG